MPILSHAHQVQALAKTPSIPRFLLLLACCASAHMTLAPIPPAVAQSQSPPRIASINMCTDQLLLDLARPERIAGLSPFARDATRSWAAGKAQTLPLLSGGAEDILMLRPDLVVSSRFMKPETRELILTNSIRLETFDVPRSIAEVKQQISRFGALIGETEKADQRLAQIDTALSRLKRAAVSSGLRVLPLSRRGWVAGRQSLMADIMAQAGLDNAAVQAGFSEGGFLTLESIVALKPDVILISQDDLRAEDQGQAMLLHPAIAQLFPPERRLIIAESLTICGGPMIVEAMDRLAKQLTRLAERP